ncbi:T9SS type A sorting domain-containing protein [Flavobacteriaceae bacterium Ap0902]|nr:T9SS type A sorting domain-containing protein [Flavobacteriaceae bacterium Ap0902]
MRNIYKNFAIVGMLTLSLSAIGQVSSYSFVSAEDTYTPLDSPTVLATTSANDALDTGVFTQDLPFTFNFNGVDYNQVNIYTDGYVTFGSWVSNNAFFKPFTSSDDHHEAIVAVFNDDLVGLQVDDLLGEISYQLQGEGNERSFIIQWKNFTRYSYLGYDDKRYEIDFQLRLNEDHTISFVYDVESYGDVDERFITVGLRGANMEDFQTRSSEGTDSSNWSSTEYGTVIQSTVRLSSTSQPDTGLTYRWGRFIDEPDSCNAVETFDFTFEDITTEELFDTYCWHGNYETYPTILITDEGGSSGDIPLPDNALQIYKGPTVNTDIILVTPEVSTTEGNYQFSFEIEYALTGVPSSITGSEKIQIGTISDKEDLSTFVPFGTPFNVDETGVFKTPGIIFPEGHKYVAMRFEFGNEPHKAMILDNIKWQPINLSTISVDTNDLKIYPNPTTSKLYIDTKEDIASIFVYDITGKIIPVLGKEVISVEHLQNGVYILNVQFVNGEKKNYKFIKK